MVTNFKLSNRRQINSSIDVLLSQVPLNIPCRVDKVNPDYTVNVISLVDDVLYSNISVFYPMGMYFDPTRLKNGLLIHSDYWFGSLKENGKLERTIKSTLTQFGVFIPLFDNEDILNIDNNFKNSEYAIYNTEYTNKILLETDNIVIDNKEKASITMEDGAINVSNNSDANYVKMTNTQLSIGSSNPIEIKTETASLYEVMNDILEMLTKMNADTVAGNGAPLASPTLTAELPGIITKLQGVLK